MATAEEVTVAGPPRVTPRLAGCRRPDCGLPGAVALVDSAPSSPPPLRPAGSSGPSTGLPSPNPEYSTWAPVRSAMLCPHPVFGTRDCAMKHVPNTKIGTCAALAEGLTALTDALGNRPIFGAQLRSPCQES